MPPLTPGSIPNVYWSRFVVFVMKLNLFDWYWLLFLVALLPFFNWCSSVTDNKSSDELAEGAAFDSRFVLANVNNR